MSEREAGPLDSPKQLSRLMLFVGVLGLIFAGVHAAAYLSSGAPISLSDALFNAADGALFLAGGVLVARRRAAAILFPLLSVVASLIYSYAVGRGFNVIALLLGGAFLILTFLQWRRGILT
ncbi:MAG: hypothetical protein R3300_07220 [Candidatus Promineifilaceae bacterium]|nr:hypothetical protein [Candidatus Promineifilaceae bacterium]